MGSTMWAARRSTVERGRMTLRCLMVTVTYNADQWLSSFLESAKQMMSESVTEVDLLAIDNSSTDQTVDTLVAHIPRQFIIENDKNVGFARGSNQGIRLALAEEYDYVLLVNNDTLLPVGLIDGLIVGCGDVAADIASPRIVSRDDPDHTWYAGAGIRRAPGIRVIAQEHSASADAFVTGYAPGCCLLVRTQVFRSIGVLDERYFVYAEDLDFMIRAEDAGLRVAVCPGLVVRHATSSSTGGTYSDFTIRWASFGRAMVASTHTQGSSRFAQAAFLAGWTLACLVTRRASMRSTLLRVNALVRGWRTGRHVAPRTAP